MTSGDTVNGVTADKLREGLAVYKHFCGGTQVGIITRVSKTSLRYVSIASKDAGAERSMSFSRRADGRTGVCLLAASDLSAFRDAGAVAQSVVVTGEQLNDGAAS